MLTEAVDEEGKANLIYKILLFASVVHYGAHCVTSQGGSSRYCNKTIARKTDEPAFCSRTDKRSGRLRVPKNNRVGTVETFTRIKTVWACILSLSLSNEKVKKLWRYTSTSLYVFIAWWLIKFRDTFTFSLLPRLCTPLACSVEVEMTNHFHSARSVPLY